MFIDDEDLENEVSHEDIKTTSEKTTPKEEDLSKKFYELKLPSKGLLGYPEVVQYRDILVRDEKIIATATDDSYWTTLHNVLKSVLGNPDFFYDICMHDRDFLLIWIWANNYTPIKSIGITCADCGQQDTMDVDLTKFDVTDIDTDIPVPFEIELSNGYKVNVRMFTIGDEINALNLSEKLEGYEWDTVMLYQSIDIGDDIPVIDKFKWIEENIRGREMALIRAFHEHFRYGVDNNIQHTCSKCGEETHFALPFRPEWLLPTASDDLEKMLRSNKKSKNKSKRRRPSSNV